MCDGQRACGAENPSRAVLSHPARNGPACACALKETYTLPSRRPGNHDGHTCHESLGNAAKEAM
eukprot:2590572-Alexandrium_andersonii.AAC.1